MTPWLSDPDVDIHVGDALDVLRGLPDGSVDCCVTSPPYWGLRDYGTGQWDGGEAGCDHAAAAGASAKSGLNGSLAHKDGRVHTPFRDVCGKCGAQRVDRQLGLEATPDLYVAAMVAVFAEVRRVLADHGTLWLNIGDSYANDLKWGGSSAGGKAVGMSGTEGFRQRRDTGLKPKDLCGIPWRLAFALQADGWWLRSDIIWAKPNPMPESVTDRPTKAHEYVFLLSKRPSYYFDQEAVREPHQASSIARGEYGHNSAFKGQFNGSPVDERHQGGKRYAKLADAMNPSGRNVRSVWEIEQTGRPNGARHALNDAYFAEIRTEAQAYWLGFLYADGYLGRRHVDLQLAEKDHDHVLAFRAALESSANVNPPRNGKSRVVISSRRMADDLRLQGMGTKAEIPAIAPELVRHFVRGVFDGDGSAWSYLPAGRPRLRYAASFLGSERLLSQIRELLGLRGKPKLERGIHRISVAAADDLARLYAYMYDGATVYLERKRVEFPQAQHVAPDVFTIATQPYPDAHFATFPEELPRRAILAGCPVAVCSVCGKARERIVERGDDPNYVPLADRPAHGMTQPGNASVKHGSFGEGRPRLDARWSDCGHDAYRPGTVLDPFLGSGTTAHVARKHGRRCVGIELNETYAQLAARRLQQLSLLAEGGYA